MKVNISNIKGCEVIMMPSHKTHKMIDVLILGRAHPEVHKYLDEPVKWLGPRHRILRHSLPEILAKYWNDPERLASAYLHLMADYGLSEIKRKSRRRRK